MNVSRGEYSVMFSCACLTPYSLYQILPTFCGTLNPRMASGLSITRDPEHLSRIGFMLFLKNPMIQTCHLPVTLSSKLCTLINVNKMSLFSSTTGWIASSIILVCLLELMSISDNQGPSNIQVFDCSIII